MSYPLIKFINETESPITNAIDIGTRLIFNMVDGLVRVKEIIDPAGNETFIGNVSAA